MKKNVRTILVCLICWAAVLAVAFGLLCAAAAVPRSSIKDNLMQSSKKLASQSPHGTTLGSTYHSIQDNYADAVLLGVAANMSSDDVLRSTLDTKYYDDGFGPAVGIQATLTGREANTDYTRYWHGSLVLIRPLLAVTDINGIRITGSVIISLLLVLDCFLLIRRKNIAACVILAVSAILVQIWFVFTSLEYMTVFIVMLAVMPLFIRFAQNARMLAVISAGTGTLTAFADFLTAETLTLLVPLTIAFFITAQKGEKPDNKKSLATAAACGAAWGGAYLLTFAAKWFAASAVLGRNVSDIAVSAAAQRISGMGDDIASPIELFFSSFGANLSMLSPVSSKINVAAIAIWLALFAGVCIFLKRRDTKLHSLSKPTMIIIACLPLLRFGVLMNHSYLHNYFTYRALMPSIMALLGLMYYRVNSTDKQKNRKKKT